MKKLPILLPLAAAVIILTLIIIKSWGFLLLGGEGNYFLDFNIVKNLHRYSWSESLQGVGFSGPTINSTIVIFDLFALFQTIFNYKLLNIVIVFLVYFLPFITMYVLLYKFLKINFKISILISLFYILNPFSTSHLRGLMFWNTAPMFVLPIAFGMIYKYFFDYKKLFICFGIFTLLACFSFANIPYLGIFHMSLIISLIIISYLHKNKLEIRRILLNFGILELSFILFNLWWLINLVRFYLYDNFYTKSFAISWAKYASGAGSVVSKIFSFKTLIPPSGDNFYYFTNFYNNSLISVFLFIPFFLLIWSLLKNKKRSGLLIFCSFFILLVFFLNKGVNPPFGWLYVLFLEKIPFFIIFKSPLEKFSLFFVFVFAISLPYIFKNLDKKIYIPLFSLYLFLCAIPFISLNFIPDSPIGKGKYVSRTFVDKDEYRFFRNKINSEKIYYRLLSLPGSLNYQVTMLNHDGKYYRGMDPLMYSINKPFIAAYSGDQLNYLFENFSEGKNTNNLMSLYGIKYILLNKDIYPSFGFRESQNIEELEKIFSLEMKKIQDGSLILFENPIFLPHFYVPKNIIYSNGGIEILLEIVSFKNYEIRSGVYLDENGNLLNRADEIFVKGELENKVSEKELEMAVKPEELFLPYVRQKPGSLSYPLLLKKEKYDKWKVRKEPEKLLEKHFFYASKRVSEIMAFGVNELILANYKKEMTDALGILKKLKQEGSKDFVKLLAKYEGTLWGQREKIREIGDLPDWNNAFQELEGQVEELKIKQDFSRFVYKIEIPKEGEYEIYLREEEIERFRDLETGELEIDGNKVEIDGDWVKLDKRNFGEGKQELTLPSSGISENLVDESLKIKDYSPNSIYQISFDYKAPKGGSFFVAEGKTGETAETQLSSTEDEFRHFEMFFKSSPDAQEAAVHLSISVSEEKNLRIERIYQPEVMLKLKNTDTENLILDTRGTMPKITFVKINPTKYRVKVEGAVDPYTLIFSESFHKGWKTYVNGGWKVENRKYYGEEVASYFEGEIKEGTHKNIFLDKDIFETWRKKPISEERHLLVNGYANSWYITPEDVGGRQDYELIIEFAPQKLFYIGSFVSGMTLLGCLLYFLYRGIVRKNRQ